MRALLAGYESILSILSMLSESESEKASPCFFEIDHNPLLCVHTLHVPQCWKMDKTGWLAGWLAYQAGEYDLCIIKSDMCLASGPRATPTILTYTIATQ